MNRSKIALMALFLLGCSDIETTPDQQRMQPSETSVGRQLAAKGLGVDPYAIGSQWYQYDAKTHTLSPKPLVWMIKRGEQPLAMIDIESYYNDKGDSGYFTLSVSTAQNDTKTKPWRTPRKLALKTNIKDVHTCVDLEAVREVSCDDPDADLIARIIARVVPEAGFAVNNPALFVRTHPTDAPETQLHVMEIEANTLDDAQAALRDNQGRMIQSVETNLDTSRVGWIHQSASEQPLRDIHLQVTTNLSLIQWQILNVEQADGQSRIELQWVCQKANAQEQPPFEDQPQTQRISLSTQRNYSASLLQLCDPSTHTPRMTEVEQSDQPYRQDWPSSANFDWLVEQIGGRVSVRPAPGHLLWNWTLGTEKPSQEWQLADVTSLWSAEP